MLKYEESANMLAELHSKPKESLDHFTKKFMDLLNIFKGSGAPMDERNKVILFLNALETFSHPQNLRAMRQSTSARSGSVYP